MPEFHQTTTNLFKTVKKNIKGALKAHPGLKTAGLENLQSPTLYQDEEPLEIEPERDSLGHAWQLRGIAVSS